MRSIVCTMFALTASCLAGAQSATAIPATSPTQAPASSVAPASAPHAAVVTWTGSALSVTANGESLRTVLLRISRATGMKVSGGVPEELVFGKYGPGPVQPVLAELFSGMSINMLLVNGSQTQPKELVLTARTGGPTPASPAQPRPSTMADPADANLAAPPHPGPHSSPDSFGGPPAQPTSAELPSGILPASGSGNPAIPALDSSAQPESPNGVRTPEQIFEELRRRQQGNTAPQQ